jgi:tetratricopeptide (TPR) repeat protein
MGVLITILVAASLVAQVASAQDAAAESNTVLAQARKLAESHQLEKANERLSEFLRGDPGNQAALVELGHVQLEQKLNEDALKSFETVLRSQPDSAVAREGEVKAAVAEALADRQAGLSDSALLCLLRARKVVPDSPELLLDFGMQAESMRIYQDADEALTKAHELAPDDLKILYALAHVQFDERKMPEAEANLRAYLNTRPDDATAHYGLGRLLHMELKNDQAKAELERSCALEPRQSASYYELGEMALEQGDLNAAKSNYEKVLAFAPHHGGALTGLGVLALRAKDYPTAETYLKSAVFYAADYPKAHHFYAVVLSRLGRQDESKRESDLATSLDAEQTKTSRGNFLTVIQ